MKQDVLQSSAVIYSEKWAILLWHFWRRRKETSEGKETVPHLLHFFSWLCTLVPEVLHSRSMSVRGQAHHLPKWSCIFLAPPQQEWNCVPWEHLAFSPPGGAIPFHLNPWRPHYFASLQLLKRYIVARGISEEHLNWYSEETIRKPLKDVDCKKPAPWGAL